MSGYIGDFPEDFTAVPIYFTTHDSNGAPVAPLTAFEADDVKIYKDGDAAQKTSTNGLTMTSPFDSIVGLHRLLIDTSNDTGDAAWWVAGHTYTVILNPDTETVNGQTALKVLGTFSLAMNLRATTNGRTLDVTATGAAGIDWGNVENPTTALNLSGTNIDTDQIVASVSGAVGSVAGNVGGTINGLTATALKDFFDTDTATTYASAVAGSVVKEIVDNSGGATITVQDIVDGVWDEPLADHLDAGSTGEALDAAASGGSAPSAADIADAVWDEDATGHQTTGTFGQAIGDPGADTDTIWALVNTNLNATVSSRATQTSVDDLPTNAELATALGTADDAVLTAIGTLPTADENADALLDRADAIETGLTPRQAMRLSAAADGGKLSGGGTATNTIRNAVADDTDRIIATVDADGNRTAITYDLA